VPEAVEDAIWGEWYDHLQPLQALDAVRDAAAAARAAQDELAKAVHAARIQGRSWTEIGAAAGNSRQAAHERWAKTT